jgi:hypothetical protein
LSSRKPPGLALWMLQHLACGPCTEVLTGDLLERYAQEQSLLWLWRQVFTTIVRGCAEEALAHKGLMVRALIAGWGAMLLFRGFILELLSWDIYNRLYPSPERIIYQNGRVVGYELPPHWAFSHPIAFRISILLCCAIAGRVAARVGGDNQRVALFGYAGSLLVFIVIEGMSSPIQDVWSALTMPGLALAVTLIAGLLPLKPIITHFRLRSRVK